MYDTFGYSTWVGKVREWLLTFGNVANPSGTAWEPEDVLVKAKATYVEEWGSRISCAQSQRMKIYGEIKQKYAMEPFLAYLSLPKRDRILLTRFRVGSHWLANLTCKFDKSCEVDSTCPVCQQTQENEEHFLFHCDAYRQVRFAYPDLLRELDLGKFMCQRDKFRVARYIAECYKIRTRLLRNFPMTATYLPIPPPRHPGGTGPL